MKISMHMMARWLDEFGPVATISDGSRDISSARLFEEGADYDPSMLYVGQTKDFFPDSASTAVMIMHGNDMVSVKTDDLNKVFNRVLMAFDRYDAAERDVELAMLGIGPEQGIVSAFEDLIGPTFIMGKDYKIIACSQNFSDLPVNRLWDEFAANREPELASIQEMRASEVVTKVLSREPVMKLFKEPAAAPYSYGLANTYRRLDGSVIGHLIIASDRRITPFEKDIASILMEALGELQSRLGGEGRVAVRERGDALLESLATGNEVPRSAQTLRALCGIEKGAPLRIVRIERYDDAARRVLVGTIRRMAPCSAVSAHDGGITMLVWAESSNLAAICDMCAWLGCQHLLKTGISNAFSDLEDCPLAYDQARFALEQGHGAGVFAQCACDYLLASGDSAARRLARHPLVDALEHLDEEHGSDLVATLREYLLCERSVKAAAARLFVHKNTVMYRIAQVRDLGMANLDDVQERTYVLLSLLVLD